MQSFFNNPQLKEDLLKQLKAHQEQDAFIKGSWLSSRKINNSEQFKGCFYGCTMQTSNSPLEAFSEKYNIDLWFCYMTEKIFENLPDGEYQSFPHDAIEAIPVGFDFDQLKSDYHKAILLKQLDWVEDKVVRDCLVFTSELFNVPFSKINKDTAKSAESAAKSAAESAKSAAKSAAESAWSAAKSAESAAKSAWSAAKSAESAAKSAESAAKSAHYIYLKNTLLNSLNNG